MKGLIYMAMVFAEVVAFLSAVCIANGNLKAIPVFGVAVVMIVILGRVLESHERG